MDYAYTYKPFDFFSPSPRFLDPPVNKTTSEMRPIYLPVKKKPDVTCQENGNISSEEPKIVSNGVPKEDYRVAVSNLISKFETNSVPSPKKPSLVKSKSFSVRGSKKEPRTNQTQDDALHNKTEAEVEEIRKLGVRDLRKKFEKNVNNTDNDSITSTYTEIKSEGKQTPLQNIARLRLEHFKRLTKKWERHVGELLRYLTDTSDFDIYNVRIQDLELSIGRELQAIKVNPEELTPQECTTPQKNPPEIEPLSHVAKIASLYEIKSKETVEEKPRTPIQVPKRLPWTTGRKEKKKEEQEQIEEDVRFQEAVVTDEIKQEEILVEEPKPEKKEEEPSDLVDTEHLKSASLITSYFNSLSNVNNRNNETSRLNSTKEEQTPSPTAEENSFDNLEQSSVLEPEESYQASEQLNESNKIAQNNSYELINEPEEEYSEQFNESSNQNDSTIEREFEKYYSEDLKPTGSEERLFDDYYRENVLEDSIPEESDEEIRAEYEEEVAQKSYSAVVDEDAAEEDGLMHEAKIVEEDVSYVHQTESEEVSAFESEENGNAVVTDSQEPLEKTAEYEDQALESHSAVVEEDKTGEDNSNTNSKDTFVDNENKVSLTKEESAENLQNRVTRDIVIVDHLPQEVQKQEEFVVQEISPEIPKDVENEETVSQCIIEEPVEENVSIDKNALHTKQEEEIVKETASHDTEEAFEDTADAKEDEHPTPENVVSQSSLETSKIEQESESESINKQIEEKPDKEVHVEEIGPLIRRHHDVHPPSEKEHLAPTSNVEESCLRKYIMDTSDFINHEKTTS